MKRTTIIKSILLVAIASGTLASSTYKDDYYEIAKQIEIFTEMYKQLNMNYVDETNPADLMDKAIVGMLDGLDPYTIYWNEQEVEKAKINRRGSYSGIGANVRTTADKLIILEPWKGLPADAAGLKAGDEIVEINGIKVSDYKENAGELLRGAADSKLDIKYVRQGKTYSTSLSRKGVDVEAVPFYELIEGDIAYIVLTKFNEKASRQVRMALEELKEKGAKKVILDLRGNPGGLLSEAVNVSNIFIEKGKLITSTKSHIDQYNKTYLTTRDAEDAQIPLAVLINGRSASASEIVSGSVQDYDRGVVVGARSFGKGLVQRPKDLAYGTQLKVTISRYYTPSGRCIQALDYWNRDEDGNAVRTKETDYKAFKTLNSGRTVFDGGGVAPDVDLPSAAYSPVTTALLKEDAIFNYATKYYYSKPQIGDMGNFQFTDADYSEFLAWIDKQNISFDTQTEREFAQAFRTASEEELNDDINVSYNGMLAAIKKAKKQEMTDKKAEIAGLLSDELVKRYFYQEGLYQYHVKNNPEIRTAVEILNDPARYRKILGK